MLWMDKLIQELKMDDLFFQLWKLKFITLPAILYPLRPMALIY